MKQYTTKFIAEIGVNHNGSIKIAKKLIDHAVRVKADYVKFQIYNTDNLVSQNTKSAPYQRSNKNINQYNLLKKYELSHEQHLLLFKYCKKKRISYLASPFDLESAKFLVEKLKLKTIKIASGEIESFDILDYFSKLKLDLILSTGASSIKEIDNAIKILTSYNLPKKKITLLHCTSSYPAKINEINLNVIKILRNKFKMNIGYSDHSEGILVSIAAYLLGATFIERHLTLNKKMKGPDHISSLEPNEFKEMIEKVKALKIILGSKTKKVTKSEMINLKYIRKSIFAKKQIKKGTKFSSKNLILKRPQIGMKPKEYVKILGKTSTKNYNSGQIISE